MIGSQRQSAFIGFDLVGSAWFDKRFELRTIIIRAYRRGEGGKQCVERLAKISLLQPYVKTMAARQNLDAVRLERVHPFIVHLHKCDTAGEARRFDGGRRLPLTGTLVIHTLRTAIGQRNRQ